MALRNDQADAVDGRRPAVSIIVPVYNVEDFVAEAIDSLRAQTMAFFEAIIVDDGSTDDSFARTCEAVAGDPRFVLVRQSNKGLSAARNAGLDAARAPVIGFLDSDDRLAPTFLETLLAVLETSNAPWAACAVDLSEGATSDVSPAIHGATHPAVRGEWAAMALDDWREIVRHWPSAWNKLYRRDLIGAARFPEGLAYEDHAWFQELAERAPVLAYVPEPLYTYRRNRPGQITADGSERVFQQFDVLDRIADRLGNSKKVGAREGFARLATRTLHERASTLRDPARRARFVTRTRDFLARHDTAWSPGSDNAISRAFAEVLHGRLPLSIVIATDGVGPGLERSLASLRAQALQDLEIIVATTEPGLDAHDRLKRAVWGVHGAWVYEGGTGSVSEARNRGLSAAKGLFTVVLDAGDVFAPETLWLWVEAMIRARADLGVARFSPAPGHVHAGSHDGRDPFGRPWPNVNTAQAGNWLSDIEREAARIPHMRVPLLHALPAAKIFRTAFLRAHGLTFAPEPLSSWAFTTKAAFSTGRAVALRPLGLFLSDAAIDRRLWRRRASPESIHAALMAMAPALDAHLPRSSWYPRLLSRALWEKAHFADFPNGAEKRAFLSEAADLVARHCADDDPATCVDGYIGSDIRALFPASVAAEISS
ncbi:MAG: glycosyltransferase [Pseudomonadota bacterium]